MDFVNGVAEQLSPTTFQHLNNYRHQVFVEMLGWELDTPDGIEQDQFDRDDTVYVIAKNEQDHISGCARLLPTTKPYLLEEVFPELLNGLPCPKQHDVWELSRFAAVDFDNHNQAPTQLMSSEALALLTASIECAKKQGAKRLISVSPLGIERMLRNAGFRYHRAGPPKIVNGYALFACYIDIA
ncbi:acyl-homoserine-lactone synthase [Agarivorans sp. OAG1]|uniref:Acyl-homoserine-lactone synthase n=1 Tax=Agarivorans albus MKT 106 TaxID=1331007 RepID=R9PNQ0_AGAAL|nr:MULTISPECIES: acyl-homoserine-lactone synthase [Agarivorans]MPW29153.1 GNAT family N-acetyltransferase [Agarivorans sp. B2Z047]UQN41706.1 GNAT family N-acetyltransferase [Agarivorans sp. B2Z047]BEU02316.1 acyl-homoserine-lactone synthase [Agarivorans sp. OAG1]GAD02888.1 homoserine lactone synthase [Agarivorans albus MKT 106]